MKKVEVKDAIGLTLCHDITSMRDGFKGAIFKRGHIIEEKDIETLLDNGKKHIFVYENKDDEIHEEEAAIRLYEMCKMEGTHKEGPSEGKIVIKSDTEGFFVVNTELLNKINNIEDITICTLPNHFPVKKDTRIASMRIIPLTTKKSNIEEAENLCKNNKLYELIQYKHKKVGIIITGYEIYTGRIKDKFENICRKKLSNFPCEIIDVKICDDDIDMIKQNAKSMIDKGVDLLVFSGGMSVDPDDVTKTSIKELGAEIVSYGVPSQPGNMTLVAYKDDICMVGVPGAAISMPITIFDVLLPQIFCDIKWTKSNLTNLAVGGVCQLCKECHYPVCTFGKY